MTQEFAKILKDAFKLAAKMLNNSADAHDLIQEAASIAMSHANAPAINSDSFKPWFFRVVRNKSIDKLRSEQAKLKRQSADSSAEIEQAFSAAATPEQDLLAGELKNDIAKALANISLEHREIVMLKDLHDFSYAEIAHILGIAKGSVMSRLHRARMALKQQLTNEE